jgi:hypothetical protein
LEIDELLKKKVLLIKIKNDKPRLSYGQKLSNWQRQQIALKNTN